MSGMQLCGALNRSGNECGLPAMDNGRCRMHGGLSTGPVNPAVKHGLYRKYLSGEEQELYDGMKADPNRDDLSAEIAMTRIMISRCFKAVVEEGGNNWRVPMQVMPQYIEKLLKLTATQKSPAGHGGRSSLADELDDAIHQMLSEENGISELEAERARDEL